MKSKNKSFAMMGEHSPTLSFIDVETTGLSVDNNDRICEIAILKVTPNGEVSHWQTLINPERPISPEASRVNHITNEMVSSAPRFRDVAEKIIAAVHGTTIVCHNAQFDMRFIQVELRNCGMSLPDLPVLDTLKIARDHFNFPSNSLGNIAGYLAIETSQAHRALADVHTTHQIFKHFVKELYKKDIEVSQLTKSCLVY